MERTELESLFLVDKTLGPGICVRLPAFEGPMDLLLYLIRRDEVDVFNIPIALITREYLNMLELMRACDLDVGGEFLMMAATLLSLKARMLLPRPQLEEGEVEDDPRRELVERLLEYKAFKESAELFREMEGSQADRFQRLVSDAPENPSASDLLENVSLFDLLVAFKRAMDRLQAEKPHYNIFLLPETLEQRMIFLREKLAQHSTKISFLSLTQELETKLAIILTFLALLELVRIGEIALRGIGDSDFYLQVRNLSE